MVGKIGAKALREITEVGAMLRLLVVAVLGASLAFASSVAFAGNRGVAEVVSQWTQPAVPGYNTGYGTVVQPPSQGLGVQFPL